MVIKRSIKIMALGLMVCVANPVQAHWLTDAGASLISWVKNTISSESITPNSGKIWAGLGLALIGFFASKKIYTQSNELHAKDKQVSTLETNATQEKDVLAKKQEAQKMEFETQLQKKSDELNKEKADYQDQKKKLEQQITKKQKVIEKTGQNNKQENQQFKNEKEKLQENLKQSGQQYYKLYKKFDKQGQTIKKQQIEIKNIQEQLDRQGLIIEGNRPHAHPFAKVIKFNGDLGQQQDFSVSIADLNTQHDEDSYKLLIDQDEIEDDFTEIKDVKIVKHFDKYQIKRKIIKPSLLKQHNRKIVLLAVHGTFSDSESFGTNELKATSTAIITFAKALSVAYDTAVEIVIFDWSGKLSADARKEAAELLADWVCKEELNKQTAVVSQIWSIAHSHGCNVMAQAAQQIQVKTGRVVDVGVQIASPSPELTFKGTTIEQQKALKEISPLKAEDEVYSFGKIYHFWAADDVTQLVGSLESKYTTNRKYDVRINKDHRVYNVHIRKEEKELNHINIKLEVTRNLAALIHAIDTHYGCHFDLDACVFNNNTKYPLVAIADGKVCYTQLLNQAPELNEHASAYSKKIKDQFKQNFDMDISSENKFWSKFFWLAYGEYWVTANDTTI